MDEPTNHLDMETIAALSQALNTYTGGVVLVTHDERLIGAVCRELWVCTRVPSVVKAAISLIGTQVPQPTESTASRVFSMAGGLAEYKMLVHKELQASMATL
ncbi:unnamed protein product [Protopolystoma xenopodis]|uniref:ABC transporter domain-containing protein n=1 Tax=Protopolystoma xenopodis TaxID=117903 RepID=A0A448X9C5_9PLAT|nr:unnamed protein product [Protopolystoma xenopodis]